MFKKLKTKIQMKFLDLFIAKMVDKFKARNPKVFGLIALGSLGVNFLCSSFAEWWAKMQIVNPQYVELASGIDAALPLITEIGYWASGVAMILSGSRTTQILAKHEEQKK